MEIAPPIFNASAHGNVPNGAAVSTDSLILPTTEILQKILELLYYAALFL